MPMQTGSYSPLRIVNTTVLTMHYVRELDQILAAHLLYTTRLVQISLRLSDYQTELNDQGVAYSHSYSTVIDDKPV